ncbi:MAG TPA: radical SAM protein [Candidatus Deferrimicrobium sp.]|nr:radical SAM protein [Candidatus Deferrimicrobium sp.]
MPKISRYSHFEPWLNGTCIAYNARSGAVALMTAENRDLYRGLVDKLPAALVSALTPPEQELVKQLQYGLFACSDSEDELESLKFQHNLARYDRSTLGMTIAPTLACNMACEYCYEANKKGRMSAELVETIIAFVEKQAPGLRRVDVGWYGGEPLLAMDIIEDLTQTIIDLGEEYKFQYTSSMISNGYLLTPETVDRLRELKISVIQVTLDGPARIHDKKRPLKNGRENFAVILENLKYAAGKLSLGVRVNVDKTFTPEIIEELLEQLRDAGLRDRVGVYFGQLEPATIACSNIADSCYDTADFSRIETAYYQRLLDYGFSIQKLPSPMSTFCMAQNVNAFLIDPDGNLYRCFNHVGDDTRSFGNIRGQINYQHPNFVKLFKFTPFDEPACRGCDILPICMGGCPDRRADRGMTPTQMCDSWKHNLQPMLRIIAQSRQQQAQSAARAQAAALATKEQP